MGFAATAAVRLPASPICLGAGISGGLCDRNLARAGLNLAVIDKRDSRRYPDAHLFRFDR